MKDMIHMGMFLFIIAAISGILLACTESITAPLILENRLKLEQQARQEVLPAAKNFTAAEFKDEAASATIPYFAGFNEQGQLAGVVIKVAPKGYAGPIEMVLGLDFTGKISGVKILSQKETPGLGTKLSEKVFVEPFKKLLAEKPAPVFMVKKDGGDVDAITAATISSRAFCSGVRSALEVFSKVQPGLSALSAPTAVAPAVNGGTQ